MCSHQDILIHAKSDLFNAFQECSNKISDKSFVSFNIHGLESSISQTISLVLKLQEKFTPKITVKCTSSSVDLVQGLGIIAKEIEHEGLKRTCAILHVTVSKKE
ncbi:uncharacterized protein LOC136083714 isoform X1 [Hydra vulgaris]|uniref:uncharacterized protein LOC136083714 isoform X1 n=1 Tax=Hydra vulgaris TaxID=6087 RepID=UPI0002B46112